jgi:alpha-D-xyloside xylohydrolase
MKRNAGFVLGIVAAVAVAGAGEVRSFRKTDAGVSATAGSVNVEIRFYDPSTVRVLKCPAGRTFDGPRSLSVTAVPRKTDLAISRDGERLAVQSERLRVSLDLKNGAVAFFTLAGGPLLREKESGASFSDFDDAGEKTLSPGQSFVLDGDEAIYGLGQQQGGRMNRRGATLRMVQNNTEDFIPFFQSVKGYGVFWDNPSPTDFADGPGGTSFTSDVGTRIDYYFLYGGGADGVIALMRGLTGQAPMLPLWTYGYWQSKERYKSQDELVGVVRRHRELGVPLDGIIQDWQYWGNNYLWNAMEFLNPEFPDPKRMVDEVHALNAHCIISIWSSFGPQTKPYRELEKIGALLNFRTWPESGSEKWPPNMDYPSGVRPYDPFNPAARDIYWKYLDRGLFSLGIDGWWMDSTEPDHLQFKPSDFDDRTFLGSFRSVRNAFPLASVGGVYDHQRAGSSDKRVFILTRSAFAGQQRYGADTWSGDVVASWDALRNQIPAGLNFSLCGIPQWNSDIGGFFLWNFRNPLENPDYRELYARWMQFGAFCPMMRSHGTDAPREIWRFGEKGDPVFDAIRGAIGLRYRLLPYLYSASRDVTAAQSTLMRALVMDFPKDRRTWDLGGEYLFGKSLLVRPVTRPMYSRTVVNGNDTTRVGDFSAAGTVDVYLPAGTDWVDFWTGETFAGGRTVDRKVPIGLVPLYARAGSILPMGPEVQYAAEKKWDDLEIRVYPGADGRFSLYEDENDTYHYENGLYSTIDFDWNDRKRTLTIGDRKGSFPGMIGRRVFRVVRVSKDRGAGPDFDAAAGRAVEYSGRRLTVSW